MFVTTHAAIGALVAEMVPNHPILAFFLGIASHFLTDMIPHGDFKMYKGYIQGTKVKRAIAYATIDAVICVLFVLFLFNTKIVENGLTTTMGITGGVMPDLIVAIYELTKARWLKWFHGVHFYFHNLVVDKRGDMAFASGFAMQLVFLAALVSRLG